MHRPTARALLLVAVAAVSLLAMHRVLQAGAAPSAPPAGASAVARGVLTGGGTLGAVRAATDGARVRTAAVAGVADALGTVASVQSDARAGADATGSAATAVVTARGLVLLGGRVTVDEVRVSARVTADAATAVADPPEVAASGVVLDGTPAELAAGGVLRVPGAGEVALGETSSAGPGERLVNGLRVQAVDPATGAATGPALVVGHLELRAVAGPGAVVLPAPRTTPAPDPDLGAAPSAPAGPPARGRTEGAGTPPVTPASPTRPTRPAPAAPAAPAAPRTGPELPIRPAPRLLPGTPGVDGSGPPAAGVPGGMAFPVVGVTSYGDDYGAPRAGTGWHQGNDLFAPVGTPVVAVADGTLSKVGWNTLGGNRLWLTDGRGTAYYYAHLSAYAPVAADGAAVRAGQVIAYVGNTGQAATTPPHLHFEVRPGGMGAPSVNPYGFLRAWQRGTPAAFDAGPVAEALPDAGAGAVVVGVVPERDAPPAGPASRAVSAR